ncbi:MAG TPA: CocE/NonD family hydrolase, partial [Candidatus Kapabacteria bacterium]
MRQHLIYILFLLAVTANAQSAKTYVPMAIPVRDGATLASDLYTMDSTVAKPVILIQTPYNKALYRIAVNLPQAGGSLPFDSVHYNYVTVDWRGFYASTAAAKAGYDRGLDGYDIIEWIATQKWSNGKVGTWGGSALGMIQFQTAKHRPPHHICAVPFIIDYKTTYEKYF